MIGGYENVIALPSMGVFDTSMMQADIAAAREQYNQARDDYKEFIKTYGDFYSPIAADNEDYYNMTKGAAQNLINQYGGNLLRSAEGRAAISRLIAETNTAALGQIKANAANYQQYLQNIQKAKMDGTYSKALEDMELAELGLDPNSWRTIDPKTGQTREWNRLGPSKYQDLNQLTSHFVDALQPTDLGRVAGKRFTNWFGISDEQLDNAFPAIYSSLAQTNNGRLFINQAQQKAMALKPDATPEELQQLTMQILKSDVRSANQEKLAKRQVIDEEGKALFEASEARKIANIRANSSRGSKSPTQSVGFSAMTAFNSGMKYAQAQARVTDKQKVESLASGFDYINKYLLSQGAKAHIWIDGKKIDYKEAKRLSDYYSKYGDYETNEKSKQQLIRNGVLDKDGNFTSKFATKYEFIRRLKCGDLVPDKNGAYTISANQNKTAGEYNQYTLPVTTSAQAQTLMSLMTGSDKPSTYDPTLGSTWNVNLGAGGWNFTNRRMSQVAGFSRESKATQKFREYLIGNRIVAHAPDASSITSYGKIPNVINRGSQDFDVSGQFMIRMSDILPFFKQMHYSEAQQKQFLKSMGMAITDRTGKTVGEKQVKWYDETDANKFSYKSLRAEMPENQQYVIVDLTRTIPNQGYTDAMIDAEYAKNAYTGGNAYKDREDDQIQSLISSGLLQ